MLIFGNKKIRLFIGSTPTKAAYIGSERVYPNFSLSVTESLAFAAAGGTQILQVDCTEGVEWTITGLPDGWTASTLGGNGPAEVIITALNNTTTDPIDSKITVTQGETTGTCTLTQEAGTKIYGEWKNVSLETENAVTSFPAGGGTAKIHMVVRREWTWNEVPGSGGEETNWSQPADVVVSDSIASVSADVLTVGSLGTTFKAATTIRIEAGTTSDAETNHRKTLLIHQPANYVTEARALKTRTLTYPVIGAGGGTSAPQWDSYPTDTAVDTLWGFTWASGTAGTWSQAKLGGSNAQTGMSFRWNGAAGNFTTLSSDGIVTASSKGTVLSNGTSGPMVTATQTCAFTNHADYGGTQVSWDTTATGTPTQEANYIVQINFAAGYLSYESVPYTGGRSNPRTTYQPGWYFKFSSGATTEDHSIPNAYGYETVHNASWSGSATGATLGAIWGEVVWSQNNSTSARSITVTREAYVVLTPNTANYPGAPTVTSNTQAYIGTCSQTGMTVNFDFRYTPSNKASKYPRFAVNGTPGGGILRAIGGIGAPIHMLSYREAIKKVLGSTTSYLNGEPQMMVLDPESTYIGAGYISGWSDSDYILGFISGQQGNFMNNYPYKYVTESFQVTGSGFTLSGIALFEKNYGDYEAAGYTWYTQADTSSPYALSAAETRTMQQLAENGVITTGDDPKLAEVDFEALAKKINALRQPDTDTYVQNEDGTWTMIPQEKENDEARTE